MGELLRKAYDLTKLLNEVSECEENTEHPFDSLTEDSLVHQTGGIVRIRISVIEKPKTKLYWIQGKRSSLLSWCSCNEALESGCSEDG